MKLQVLAALLLPAEGSTNAEIGHDLIFHQMNDDFWRQDYLKEVVQKKFPKSWQKWIDNKKGQLDKMGTKTWGVYKRCGQFSNGYKIDINHAPFIEVLRDPAASSAEKSCAIKDWIIFNTNKWTEAHLKNCKSYQRNNHFEKRLKKWDTIYNRVFDCETETTPSPTTKPSTTPASTAEPEQKCGCYAPDEEIPIENDKCVMDLGSMPNLADGWSFSFEAKFHSWPTDNIWQVEILTVFLDGSNKYPNKLTEIGYSPGRVHGGYTAGGWASSTEDFELNEWYKFTTTGSQEGTKCKQKVVIEGPGLRSYVMGVGYVDDVWTQESNSYDCLLLEEEYPLRVYGSRDFTSKGTVRAMDGVVRNLSFTNTATDTTLNKFCPTIPPSVPECGCYAPDEEIPIENDQCVMDLGSMPNVEDGWSFSFEAKFYSWPTDDLWQVEILSVFLDGSKKYPYELTEIGYAPGRVHGGYSKAGWASSTEHFELNEWYTFTTTGSQEGTKCKQKLVIEGPGLRSYVMGVGYVDDVWTRESNSYDCLLLEEEYPLRVYGSRDFTSKGTVRAMDGVVRNLSFTNTATDTTLNKFCPTLPQPEPECGCYAENEVITIEENKCVLNIGSLPDNKASWIFSFEIKFNSLPSDELEHHIFQISPSGSAGYVSETRYKALMAFSYQIKKYSETNIIYSLKQFVAAEDPLDPYSSDGLNFYADYFEDEVVFEANVWYKFTISGSPDGESYSGSPNCKQSTVIESSSGTFKNDMVGVCFITTEDLKVYTTGKQTYFVPKQWDSDGNLVSPAQYPLMPSVDGSIRNVSFKNLATETTSKTACSED